MIVPRTVGGRLFTALFNMASLGIGVLLLTEIAEARRAWTRGLVQRLPFGAAAVGACTAALEACCGCRLLPRCRRGAGAGRGTGAGDGRGGPAEAVPSSASAPSLACVDKNASASSTATGGVESAATAYALSASAEAAAEVAGAAAGPPAASAVFITEILYYTAAVLPLMLLASAVLHAIEGWPLWECLYFCLISASGLGMGDVEPRHWTSRLVFCMYMWTNMGAMLGLLGTIGILIHDRVNAGVGATARLLPGWCGVPTPLSTGSSVRAQSRQHQQSVEHQQRQQREAQQRQPGGGYERLPQQDAEAAGMAGRSDAPFFHSVSYQSDRGTDAAVADVEAAKQAAAYHAARSGAFAAHSFHGGGPGAAIAPALASSQAAASAAGSRAGMSAVSDGGGGGPHGGIDTHGAPYGASAQPARHGSQDSDSSSGSSTAVALSASMPLPRAQSRGRHQQSLGDGPASAQHHFSTPQTAESAAGSGAAIHRGSSQSQLHFPSTSSFSLAHVGSDGERNVAARASPLADEDGDGGDAAGGGEREGLLSPPRLPRS